MVLLGSDTVSMSWRLKFSDRSTGAEIRGAAGPCKKGCKLYRPRTGWTQFSLAYCFSHPHSRSIWLAWKRRAIKIKNVEILYMKTDYWFFSLSLSCIYFVSLNFLLGGQSPGSEYTNPYVKSATAVFPRREISCFSWSFAALTFCVVSSLKGS